MEFVDNDSPVEKAEPTTKRTATVNPNIICGDCVITPEEYKESLVAPVDRIIYPKDIVEIKDDDEAVYIIGTKDGKVTKMGGFENMKNLKTIVLRCCLVSEIEGLDNNPLLHKLELYDNQIEIVPSLHYLQNLRILDLSFNSIRTMTSVSACPLLEELYMAQNKLRTIEGLATLVNLKVLDLGANRIRSIEGLEHNVKLRSLWLGKNKIEALTGVSGLKELKQLDVQNNRLTAIGDELLGLTNLEELYLACNAIENVSGLPPLSPLNTVDLSNNNLKSIDGIEAHPNLEEVWMTKSELASYDALAPLTRLPKLSCVYLEHSPIAKDFEYRMKLTAMIPTLVQLDATLITRR